jgi:hypothetical protein
MKKKRISIIVAIIAGIMLISNSCTKISEKSFVGKWRVISWQTDDHDGEGWHEDEYLSSNHIITFYNNGYCENYNDGDTSRDSWAFIESTGQLKVSNMLFSVIKYENKELELEYYDSSTSFRVFMKKID